MAAIRDWLKRMFGALMPSPESSAWDELKRARAMTPPVPQVAESRVASRVTSRYPHRY